MLFFTFDPQLTTMTARTILILRVVLGAVALLIGFRVYRIIMEPIEFQGIKDKLLALQEYFRCEFTAFH